jgi:gliding motility-associated protein GldL
MANHKKKSLVRIIQDFMASYQGKVLLNYAYSWGAAIVILGTLFKLTHLPGANIMLFLGMGTEVLVFIISAFDRPSKSYKWESVFPDIQIAGSNGKTKKITENQKNMAELVQQTVNTNHQPKDVAQVSVQSDVNESDIIVSKDMIQTTEKYLEQLRHMTHELSRFSEQTKLMAQDADQMNTLNKNLTGINAIYEIQLRSISSQLNTIDEINEQSKKMAQQINELNVAYARMLEAMTVNNKTV